MRLFTVVLMIVAGGLYWFLSAPSSMETTLDLYKSESNHNAQRIKRFQKDFKKALQKPNDMQWVSKLYTEGLNCHVAYLELSPSFLALTELHQALYQEAKGFQKQELSWPQEVLAEFDRMSEEFHQKVKNLENIQDFDTYEKQLDLAYQSFVVGFIKNHNDFFQKRFHHTLSNIYDCGGTKLDIINNSFFACQEDWPGNDRTLYTFFQCDYSPKQIQCEQLYAYCCQNGKILILGYNTREYTCSSPLHIYVWNVKQAGSKPERITMPPSESNVSFDELSPQPREGGCGRFNSLTDFVCFDGRYLKFAGYDYVIYRSATYDTMLNGWKFISQPCDENA